MIRFRHTVAEILRFVYNFNPFKSCSLITVY